MNFKRIDNDRIQKIKKIDESELLIKEKNKKKTMCLYINLELINEIDELMYDFDPRAVKSAFYNNLLKLGVQEYKKSLTDELQVKLSKLKN